MILSITMEWLLLIGIPVIVAIPVFFLIKKIMPPRKGGDYVVASFLPGAIISIILKIISSDLTVVHPDMTVSEFIFWGTGKYTGTDGKDLEVKKTPGKSSVILNESASVLAIEPIRYSVTSFGGGNDEDIVFLDPHTLAPNDHTPDYMPLETPPNEVTIHDGSSETRYWLRKANEDEMNVPEDHDAVIDSLQIEGDVLHHQMDSLNNARIKDSTDIANGVH